MNDAEILSFAATHDAATFFTGNHRFFIFFYVTILCHNLYFISFYPKHHIIFIRISPLLVCLTFIYLFIFSQFSITGHKKKRRFQFCTITDSFLCIVGHMNGRVAAYTPKRDIVRTLPLSLGRGITTLDYHM